VADTSTASLTSTGMPRSIRRTATRKLRGHDPGHGEVDDPGGVAKSPSIAV
jgi:hypothetical protein